MAEKPQNPVTQRFKEAIGTLKEGKKWKTQSELAGKLEWDQSSLNLVLNGGRNVPVEKAIALCNKYHISTNWMISGKGKLNDKDPHDKEKGIKHFARAVPMYDIDVSASDIEVFNDKSETPSGYISAPGFEDCDFWLPVFGHSAYPTYENGVLVGYRRIKDINIIAYGEYHLIITAEQRLLKRILKSDKPDNVLAVSDNPEMKDGRRIYDSFEIPKAKILKLYLAKGCVKRNQM